MGSCIRVLPEDLVNRIAAGEVVERPASVVKELVENSLDAGATDVRVEVTGGGVVLVRVTDDGVGMSPDDARLSIERHATSKLAPGSDLVRISTLGFRGEALPSIASVSRMRLVTRERGSDAGTEIRVEGGRVTRVSEAASPPGTSVEIEDLFFNTPARRKFLRREGTESSAVAETVLRLALGRPPVGFGLVRDGREALEAPPAASLSDRILALLGRETARTLHRVDGLSGEVAVHGYVSAPGTGRATAAGVHLFVNSRPIRDRALAHAVVRAYGTLLERGRYPTAVLFVEMPPDQVDVNVHPTKAEVRFRDPRAIAEAVYRGVAETIRAAPWAGEASGSGAAAGFGKGLGGTTIPARYSYFSTLPAGIAAVGEGDAPAPAGRGSEPAQPWLGEFSGAGGAPPAHGLFATLRLVGFFRATYIVCESETGLVLVDQHAAHERILFEELKRRYADAGVAGQGLLIPRTIDMGEERTVFALAHADELERLGFVLEPFGPKSLVLRSIPVVLVEKDAVAALADIVEEIRAWGRAETTDDTGDALLARIACHAAFRSGDALSPADGEAILARLSATDRKSHCPHGRPLSIELPLAEIERRVGRR